MNYKKIIFILIAIFYLSCNNEILISPDKDEITFEIVEPSPFKQYSNNLSCIPSIQIKSDTTVNWLGLLNNPYKGRREFGYAEADIEHFNYKWKTSARAIESEREIKIILETFKSEELYYSFLERMIFDVSKNVDRCTSLSVSTENSPNKITSIVQYYLGDYDVVSERYYPDENYLSTLELLELDTLENRIKGKFDLQVIIDRSSFFEEIPDTIHFANGVFECDIL